MYLRTVRAKGAEGVEFEYICLVEAYWENGRSKQRIIANLGRKDLLAPHLESLIELLGGGKRTKGSSAERIEATLAAWGAGPGSARRVIVCIFHAIPWPRRRFSSSVRFAADKSERIDWTSLWFNMTSPETVYGCSAASCCCASSSLIASKSSSI
jgi:hypothetical protein